MSVYDDPGYDLDGSPAEQAPKLPATESRGGRAVDWDAVRPGEELPELTEQEND